MAWDDELEHLVTTAAMVLGEEALNEAVARAIGAVTRPVAAARPADAPALDASQERFYETLRAELTRVLRPQ